MGCNMASPDPAQVLATREEQLKHLASELSAQFLEIEQKNETISALQEKVDKLEHRVASLIRLLEQERESKEIMVARMQVLETLWDKQNIG